MTCTKCNQDLPEKSFPRTRVGLRRACKVCQYTLRIEHYSRNPATGRIAKDRVNANARAHRRDPRRIAQTIVADSRGADRKANRSHNLTRLFVETAISNGCSYCGEREIRMTLDRIDNSIGHLTTNVVPACIRCNYIRRDMPYAAWMAIVPSIRQARQAGLFSGWNNRVR